jgi:hypothetical protein
MPAVLAARTAIAAFVGIPLQRAGLISGVIQWIVERHKNCLLSISYRIE